MVDFPGSHPFGAFMLRWVGGEVSSELLGWWSRGVASILLSHQPAAAGVLLGLAVHGSTDGGRGGDAPPSMVDVIVAWALSPSVLLSVTTGAVPFVYW